MNPQSGHDSVSIADVEFYPICGRGVRIGAKTGFWTVHCLDSGISVVAITYRLAVAVDLQQATLREKILPPRRNG